MTSRRPIRITGKCAFHASAQSASWTMRVWSSPMGRSPKACRWPSAAPASATAVRTTTRSVARTYARTRAGRDGSMAARRASSTSTNAGSTVVPPDATRLRISLTASTASESALTASSSQVPSADVPSSATGGPSAERVSDAVHQAAAVIPDRLARCVGVGLQGLALLLGQAPWDDDPDEDVEVAARSGSAQVRHSLAPQPQLGARLRAGPNLDLLRSLDRGHLRPGPERRLGDRDVELVIQLGALP